MPNPYPNARFYGKRSAHRIAEVLGIDIDHVFDVVRNYEDRNQAKGPRQWWCRGTTPSSKRLEVLIQEEDSGDIGVIHFREI